MLSGKMASQSSILKMRQKNKNSERTEEKIILNKQQGKGNNVIKAKDRVLNEEFSVLLAQTLNGTNTTF